MKKYCCEVLKRFIEEDKYGAGLTHHDNETGITTRKIMISCIKEFSFDLKTSMNIVIRYCPFCGRETDKKSVNKEA